jgi:maltose alpha-D-glucosyltransferase / alpha-amylase
MNQIKNELSKLWKSLYPDAGNKLLDAFIVELNELKQSLKSSGENSLWYKEAVVYSLYVDLFNKDFAGLNDKIPYLKNLGVNCLWLLPVLESPMKDAGFDISDYRRVRADLCGENAQDDFYQFIENAHKSGIKVIFDIAINHTSNQHDWFKRSALPEKNKYTDYYIWSENDRGYADARVIFKGMLDSNWEKFDENRFYFHRFFEFQPDLNYRNPNVLLDMCRNLMFWIEKGVDGFRVDAIPYLWKEECTDCENLPQTHQVVKFFRQVVEYLNSEVILLAEACQKPVEVVKYLGDGDECHAGYHFPLMPQIYKSIAMQSANPIVQVLDTAVTPAIPENCSWFTFLRCHDELSLELVYVTEEDRKYIHSNYCHKPEWDFRLGEGISARLSELFKFDTDKILMAYSLILSLPGTPVIYYGDEFGKANDDEYYKYQIEITGHDDTRNLVRGTVNWECVDEKLADKSSLQSKIFDELKSMIEVRKLNSEMIYGNLDFISTDQRLLAFQRQTESAKFVFIHNLSEQEVSISDLLDNGDELIYCRFAVNPDNKLLLAKSFLWIKKSE